MDENIAAAVIAALGGITAAHRATGIPTTTIHYWKQTGEIPAWRHAALKEAAAREGIKLPKAFLKNGRAKP
jgi:hypothetical protein